MSSDHVITNPDSHGVIEHTKTRPESSGSKLHQVLLAHMIKNSKTIENKTEE